MIVAEVSAPEATSQARTFVFPSEHEAANPAQLVFQLDPHPALFVLEEVAPWR